jgi:putative two-component system response regulator
MDARVYVVDDEPANVKLLERILAQAGYSDVRATTDPRECLTEYARRPFDLLLLDLNMPYMDGFEVMERLHGMDPESYPPVLVLTALSDRDSRVRALQNGARDFVTKPFDRVELLSRIRNLLDVRLMHEQIKSQNRLLEERVGERTKELQDTRLEIIRRLGRAAEYRDNETGLHIIRMSKMAACLARAVGMPEAQAELLLQASPMHDIGKIGIPDSILLKPGKLDPAEWQVMKTHTTIGAEILSGHHSDLLEMARVVALSHHERWDGSGYPSGSRGEEIPLVGRVVALADVFDALTSERPYKKAWSVGDAVDEVRRSSGSHFDPRLVEAFMDRLPVILDIRKKHEEPGEAAGVTTRAVP